MISGFRIGSVILAGMLMLPSGRGEEIKVAVATNFVVTAKALAADFEKQSGHSIKFASGSTGKHYAQIRHGAPFDVFLAADGKRPQLLEQEGLAMAGSRFTYAIGEVVLWSPDKSLVDPEAAVLADREKFRRLALANPKLAPYGSAAQQILEKLGRWKDLRRQVVIGENIGQTFQFVFSGNAQLGFVALSQLKQPGREITGSLARFDPKLHTPIEQQAIQLKEGEAAKRFLEFLRSDAGTKIIRSFGYSIPGDPEAGH